MKKFKLLILTSLFPLLTSLTVHALDVDVDATATFRTAVAVLLQQSMDFGVVEFSAAASGPITLNTDGSVDYSTGLSGSGAGQAGQLLVAGDAGTVVNISCEATGTLSNGTQSMALINTKISAAGAQIACSNLSAATLLHTISANEVGNQIAVGTTLVATLGALTPSTYSTALSGGDPITVRVLYQ